MFIWYAPKINRNPLFTYTQALKNYAYLFFSFNLLIILCESFPVVIKTFKKGKILYGIRFQTQTYSFLKDIQSLFYQNINGKLVKYISNELLLELNLKVLTFWFSDDGSYELSGVSFHIQGFTLNDVYKLAGMLHYTFGLKCSIHYKKNNKGVIYIKAKSMPLFKSLVIPFMHPSMLYKLKM